LPSSSLSFYLLLSQQLRQEATVALPELVQITEHVLIVQGILRVLFAIALLGILVANVNFV